MPKKGRQGRNSRSKPEPVTKRSSSEQKEAPTPASNDRDEKPRKKRAKNIAKKSNTEVSNENIPEKSELSDLNDIPQTQRMRVMERNRIAATKCRTRKRSEASTLASCEQQMEEQHRQLSSCFESLRHELYVLKTQLLQHTDCNCVLIQRYIANEAKKSVDRMTGEIGTLLQTPGPLALTSGAPVITSGAVNTPIAPSVPGSMPYTPDMTTSSSMEESLQTQSPMINGTGDVMETPYTKGFSGGDSGGSVPTPMMSGYRVPGMIPYNQETTGAEVGAYGLSQSDLINTQYAQEHQHLDYTNNMAWSPGWQTG
ncbi:bZIP transcription factor domain-containing protein [Sarocladium implicatum]|nr:bZIP transcription factor domain-containing protein [Sarocladium implicatum]